MPGPVRYAEVKKLLESKGYVLLRISGSHHIFGKEGVETRESIPVHKGKVKHVYYRKVEKLPQDPPADTEDKQGD